jgi:hypothetical protein
VTTRRSLATLAVALLILVAGVALLYVTRAQVPPTTAVSTPIPTVTATATASATSTPPPKTSADSASTIVACGILVVNSITSGQGSGPNTYELLSPTGVSVGRFGWDAGQSALGTYVCVRLIPGAPMAGFNSLIRAGETGYVPQPTIVATDSCGSVTAYAADGAHMLVTLAAGGAATQYNLQFQFVGGTSPTDIGTRQQAGTPQLLLITGAQVAPDSGSPNAISLRQYNVARVSGCTPTSSVNPRPAGFTLALGCAYIGQPVSGTEFGQWDVDCGAASNNARGTLAYPLAQQGWVSCGVGLGNASWAKGTARLTVSEGAGGPGGYPKITQPVRPAATSSCP